MIPSIPFGCISILVFLLLLLLFPFFLANAMVTALARLGLSPAASILIAFGIFFGGMINIPIKRIPRNEIIEIAQFNLFGFNRLFPGRFLHRRYTTIAVNVGGCIVPCLLAGYEILRLAGEGFPILVFATGSTVINIAVCYWLARPIPRVGIALPPLIPAVVAALCGVLFAGELAPLVAFTSGVLGPLIGADLLHIRSVLKDGGTGVASIGGAGTFDGIVLSSLVATLLA